MSEDERKGAFRRVWGSRWLSGVATAAILLGVFGATGLVLGNTRSETAAMGASSTFVGWLTIPGIVGDSNHGNDIGIESFSWGLHQGGAALPGVPGGKVTVAEVVITKRIDKSSPILMDACCSPRVFASMTIALCLETCKPKSDIGFRLVLNDAYISSYRIDTSSTVQTESITLNYQKFSVQYRETDTPQVFVCPAWLHECTRA